MTFDPPFRLHLRRLLLAPGLSGLLALGACTTNPPTPTPAAAAPLALPTGYRLVWADEFDVPGLPNPTRWVYDTGMNAKGWHNNELQYYGRARPENSVVSDGQLFITARLESLSSEADWGRQRYTAARLITQGRAEWTYGFVEVRAKLPCGRGTWPAIWMLGSQGDWPAGGELDILEHVGKNEGHVFSTVHTTSGSGGDGKGGGQQLSTVCTAFHNYQMHWTPQAVRFGIDGHHHFTYRNAGAGPAQWPFDRPQFLILNIAIGGDLGGEVDDRIFPVQMVVDHVRVWQRQR